MLFTTKKLSNGAKSHYLGGQLTLGKIICSAILSKPHTLQITSIQFKRKNSEFD